MWVAPPRLCCWVDTYQSCWKDLRELPLQSVLWLTVALVLRMRARLQHCYGLPLRRLLASALDDLLACWHRHGVQATAAAVAVLTAIVTATATSALTRDAGIAEVAAAALKQQLPHAVLVSRWPCHQQLLHGLPPLPRHAPPLATSSSQPQLLLWAQMLLPQQLHSSLWTAPLSAGCWLASCFVVGWHHLHRWLLPRAPQQAAAITAETAPSAWHRLRLPLLARCYRCSPRPLMVAQTQQALRRRGHMLPPCCATCCGLLRDGGLHSSAPTLLQRSQLLAQMLLLLLLLLLLVVLLLFVQLH
jgi:hypothetical protein